MEVLKEGQVLPVFKVDEGPMKLAGTGGKTTSQGLDDLAAHCRKHYETDARFATWHVNFKIDPSKLVIPKTPTFWLAMLCGLCWGPCQCPCQLSCFFGGLWGSDLEATCNFNAINQLMLKVLGKKKPWSLTYSFGWAVQHNTLKSTLPMGFNTIPYPDSVIIRKGM